MSLTMSRPTWIIFMCLWICTACGSAQNIESFAGQRDNTSSGDADASTQPNNPRGNASPDPLGQPDAPRNGQPVRPDDEPEPGSNSNPQPLPPHPNGTLGPEADEASAFSQEVFKRVNEERAAKNLVLLTWDSGLFKAAQSHAVDMKKRNFFDHTNPDGQTPGDRILALGIRTSGWGENIAFGQKTPEDVMASWMRSTGHRANILKGTFRKLGVGYHEGMWVQVFSNGP